MHSTFKLLFYAKRNAPKRDGSIPIMGRITVDGSIAQFSIKTSVRPERWNAKEGKVFGRGKKSREINLRLARIRTTINDCYFDIRQEQGYVTAERIKNAYLGIAVRHDTFLALFASHNEQFARKVGYCRSQRTYDKYCNIYKLMCAYIRQRYDRDDIPLKSLDSEFINGFEYYLRTVRRCCTNTVWLYMIAVKHIIAVARNEGLLECNPFAGYSIAPKQVDRGFLLEKELQLLMKTPMKSKAYERIRDLFVFSAFTGLSYIDIKNLTTDNLKTFLDGHTWIITRRCKTNAASNVRLLDVPKRIIEKYKGTAEGNKLFKVPSNGNCNLILKEIGKQCGFSTKLTFHVGRHTFSTSLTLAKGVPIETVSRMLGHASIKTTQIYAKITNDKISRDMEILSRKLEDFEKRITENI